MLKTRLHPLAAGLQAMRWPLTAAGLLAPGLVAAAPAGGQVVAGQAAINTPNAGTVVVNQASHSAAINWQQFSVGNNEYVVFNQPSASATVLNRVVGGMPSEILGNISANGRVFLVNPNGIAFGKGSQVDVGSLVASTLDIANEDFMKGRYVFAGAQNGNGKVSNAGTLTARDGGFVVLAGQQVSNSGLIQARLGDVALGAGSAVTLDVNGNGLVNFVVDRAAVSNAAGVENLGEITANGGVVVMAANVARSLIGNAVNNSGRISAGSIEEHDGAIYLSATGGNIAQNGTLDVSGIGGADGGTVRVTSDKDIVLGDQARILARGTDGGEVRLIAEQKLDTATGSLIDGRATSRSGKGGFVELSGHQAFRALGQLQLGKDGTLLIDPNTISVVENNQSGCYGADACIGTDAVEGFLNQGTNVYIIAADSITIDSFGADNTLNATGSGNLFFGIGSPASGSVPGGDSYGGSQFVRGTAQSEYGGFIRVASSALKVDIAGSFEAVGAEDKGDVEFNDIAASDITITTAGNIKTGKLTADSGYIDLFGRSVSTSGALEANSKIQIVTTDGSILLGGDVTVQNGGVEIHAAGHDGDYYGIQIAYENAAGDYVAGNVSGRGLIDLTSDIGAISVGDVTLENSGFDGRSNGQLSVTAAGDVVVNGLVSAISDYGGVHVDITSTDGKIELRGAQGYGGLTSLIAESLYNPDETPHHSQAIVSLTAHNDIVINGAVSIRAEAVPVAYSQPIYGNDGYGGLAVIGETEVSTLESTASLIVQTCNDCIDFTDEGLGSEGNITFEGPVSVTAQGDAIVVASTEGNIAFNNSLTVTATAAVSDYTHSFSDSSETFHVEDGNASVVLLAGNEVINNQNTQEFESITTSGVKVSGPNATVLMNAGQLRLGHQEGQRALEVVADGARFTHRFGDASEDLTSDYALASVSLIGSNAINSPVIGIDGGVLVQGPAALMQIASAGDVFMQGGDLQIQGTGYRVSGDDWSLFDAPLFPGLDGGDGQALAPIEVTGPFSHFSAEGDDAVPNSQLTRLDSGELVAGRGNLFISGYDESAASGDAPSGEIPLAGNVQIVGNIEVSGSGAANVAIHANGLTVDGNIDVSAQLGSINGIGQTTFQLGEGVPTIYQYAFSNGNGGAARYSHASFSLTGNGAETQVAFDDLTVEGGGAVAVLDNIGRLEAENVTIAGGRGQNTPNFVESLTITPPSGSAQTFTTEVTGDTSLFDVGFVEAGEVLPSVVSISGALNVTGTGIAGAVVRGSSVSIGSVNVVSDLGVYRTTNPDYSPTIANFGDALAWIEATGSNPAAIDGNLNVEADGKIHLGVRADVGGNATIKAGQASVDGAIDQTLPSSLVGFQHPAGSQFEGAVETSNDVALANTSLSANNITLQFTGDSAALDSSVLSADGTLTLIGGSGTNNGTLDAGEGLDWSGNVIDISHVRLASSGRVKLTAVDDIRLGPGTLIDSRTAVLEAGDVAQSTGAVAFDVGGVSIKARQISMLTTDFTVGGVAVSLGADAALLAGLPANLRPLSTGPNAAFQAADGVTLGNLVMGGDYLFVRTDNFNPLSIGRGDSDKAAGDSLFMNVRRFGNSQTLNISAITLDPRFAELQATYVYGGSNYSGDLVTQRAIDLGPTNSNMVLLTTGRIIGKDLISPSGSVLVLKGTEPQPPPPEGDTIPETNTAQRTATELRSLASEFSSALPSIQLAGADLIEQTSDNQDEELQCK